VAETIDWKFEVQNVTMAMAMVLEGAAVTVLPSLTAKMGAGQIGRSAVFGCGYVPHAWHHHPARRALVGRRTILARSDCGFAGHVES